MIKKHPFYYVLIAITGVSIIVSAIITKQVFIKILPCIISLFVQMLSARANRWTYLLGGINCIIYSIGYFLENLFGSLFQALIISMPIQISAFIMWGKRNKNYKYVLIKKLSLNKVIILACSLIITYPICWLFFKFINSSNIYLDTAIFVIGVYASVLSMLGFLESPFIEFIKFGICVALWTIKCYNNMSCITYVIFNVYATLMTFIGFKNWLKFSKIKKGENNG